MNAPALMFCRVLSMVFGLVLIYASSSSVTGGAGRTLSHFEASHVVGGNSAIAKCCATPSRCQLPSPNPACSTYNTKADCGTTSYYQNPAGSSLNDCAGNAVPSCTARSTTNACLTEYSCYWDLVMGVCYPSLYGNIANSPTFCTSPACD